MRRLSMLVAKFQHRFYWRLWPGHLVTDDLITINPLSTPMSRQRNFLVALQANEVGQSFEVRRKRGKSKIMKQNTAELHSILFHSYLMLCLASSCIFAHRCLSSVRAVNLFLGNKVIFLAAIAFYGSSSRGRRGRQPRDHVVSLRALSSFSSPLHCSRAKFVPHATSQPTNQPGRSSVRAPK